MLRTAEPLDTQYLTWNAHSLTCLPGSQKLLPCEALSDSTTSIPLHGMHLYMEAMPSLLCCLGQCPRLLPTSYQLQWPPQTTALGHLRDFTLSVLSACNVFPWGPPAFIVQASAAHRRDSSPPPFKMETLPLSFSSSHTTWFSHNRSTIAIISWSSLSTLLSFSCLLDFAFHGGRTLPMMSTTVFPAFEM